MVRKSQAKRRFVSYLRVSTARQGASGLGVEAQREAVRAFLAGLHGEHLREFEEVESGKHADRPKLREAMETAKLAGATLLIAKLDRLSRDAHFLLGLQKTDVDFVACDMPDANRMTVGIMALVAQHEREAISARTKAALQAAKAKGRKLGNPNGARALKPHAALGRARSQAAIKARADAFAASVRSHIEATGLTSPLGIARALNEQGILTAKGSHWTPTSVRRVLAR